jgi:hypothetical protein
VVRGRRREQRKAVVLCFVPLPRISALCVGSRVTPQSDTRPEPLSKSLQVHPITISRPGPRAAARNVQRRRGRPRTFPATGQ